MVNPKAKLAPLLSFTSRKILYNFLLFYDLSSLFSKKIAGKNYMFSSFKELWLGTVALTPITPINRRTLIRARIICMANSVLYLDLGKKSNLVKPKFRNNFKTVLNNEFLFYFDKSFQLCTLAITKCLLQQFQYKSFKFLQCELRSGFNIKSFVFLLYKKSSKFFFMILQKHFFSNYQKKINFLQFNILFKKYKY